MAREKDDLIMVRPDPRTGRLGDSTYAETYARSHDVDIDSFDYRTDYAELLLLDGLSPEGYSLLDVGCGTAGYHRLLKRQGRVHGIDPIPEMIAHANRFKTESGIRGAEYSCCTFEDFTSTEQYDAIDLRGVYGWYMPWRGKAAILAKVRDLLKPGGLVALSYVPPRSPLSLAKAILFPGRTVLIPRTRFLRMVRAARLVPKFEIRECLSTVLIAGADATGKRGV